MEIRANAVDYKALSKYELKASVTLTLDSTMEVPVIMILKDGKLLEWTRGMPNIKSYLKYGYVRFQRNCPFRRFKECLCESCDFYLIQGGTGDCAMIWAALRKE